LGRLEVLQSLIVEKGCYAEAEKELSKRKGCPIDRVENSEGELEGEEAFRREYLYATTLAVRQGARFAMAVGAIGESEMQEAEQLCTSLEQAVQNPSQPIKPTPRTAHTNDRKRKN